MQRALNSTFSAICGALALFLAVVAASVPADAGGVLLTVTGEIRDAPQTFDIDRLKALPSTTVSTRTIWTEGVQSFTGVSLDTFLASIGARGRTLHATALNEYAIDIPVSDARAGGPIIAYARNGELMTVRDKGPLWVVYPYDSNSEYRTDVIYTRSIWQLIRLEVRK